MMPYCDKLSGVRLASCTRKGQKGDKVVNLAKKVSVAFRGWLESCQEG